MLTDAQRAHYEDRGYVVVRDVLDADTVAAVVRERDEVLDTVAAGLRASLKGHSLESRLLELTRESGVDFSPELDITLQPTLPRIGGALGPALFALLTHPRLLDVVGSIVGPEISSSPIQHFRWKLPAKVSEGSSNALVMRTPWHQDAAVVAPEADDTPVLTVWIPLCDVPVELGPLCVLPGSHQQGLLTHVPQATGLTVAESELPTQDPVALEVRTGDVILQNRYLVHASLDNTTDSDVRLSLDVRYQPTGLPSGRAYLPSFVARSSSDPDSELRDPAAWVADWDRARDDLERQPPDLTSRWLPAQASAR